MVFDLDIEEHQLVDFTSNSAAGRTLEDVDYWRKASGWFDDDESMKAYNSGVYQSNYNVDDDSSGGSLTLESLVLRSTTQIFGAIIVVIILAFFLRAITNGLTRRDESDETSGYSEKKRNSRRLSRHRRRSSSRGRSKNKNRSRSRSKSKSKSESNSKTADSYAIMEDIESKGDYKTDSSGRSKTKSGIEESLV